MAKTYWDEYTNFQRVKHELIRTYLGGWLPKLTLGQYGNSRVVYFDTHAGRGVHAEGELGSPLVALKTIVEHRAFPSLGSKQVVLWFFENEPDNLTTLQGEIKKFGTLPKNVSVEAHEGDCFKILGGILDHFEKGNTNLAPSFVFCDPFGFKIPGELLKRLMKFRGVELFINVMYRELDMSIAHGHKGEMPGMTTRLNSIFDGERWREIDPQMDYEDRADKCAELFKDMVGAQWATHIRMVEKNKTRYFLLHLTNHDAGREEMKECMWKVAPAEGYYVRKGDNRRQEYLIKPEPDLQPLENWIVERLLKEPTYWRNLVNDILPEVWLPKHVNATVKKLQKDGTLAGSEFEGRFALTNNPLLTLTK